MVGVGEAEICLLRDALIGGKKTEIVWPLYQSGVPPLYLSFKSLANIRFFLDIVLDSVKKGREGIVWGWGGWVVIIDKIDIYILRAC